MSQLLTELLKISRLDDAAGEENSDVSLDDLPPADDVPAEDELDLDLELGDSEDVPEDDLPGEEVAPQEPQDPNRAGLIRAVPKAHLVYKRAREDGTFTELWVYKADTVKDGVAIRTAILSGTDIEKGRTASEDGSQEYETWSAGNVEMISITGLPS